MYFLERSFYNMSKKNMFFFVSEHKRSKYRFQYFLIVFTLVITIPNLDKTSDQII